MHDLYRAFPTKRDEGILILGCTKLGQQVASYCVKAGHPFIVVDKKQPPLEALYRRLSSSTPQQFVNVQSGDATGELPAEQRHYPDQYGLRTMDSATSLGQGITLVETTSFRLFKVG